MRKLLILMVLLILTACTPDENTGEDMQAWYDQCEAIESCAAKIDELREGELSESEIIAAIQADIAALKEEQDAQAQRIADLEERTSRLEALVETSALATYLEERGIEPYALELLDNGDGAYEILIDWPIIRTWAEENGKDINVVKAKVLELITTHLADVVDKDKIIIVIWTDDEPIIQPLSDLITE